MGVQTREMRTMYRGVQVRKHRPHDLGILAFWRLSALPREILLLLRVWPFSMHTLKDIGREN